MAMYITKDNFVWLDVTDRMKYAQGNERDEIWVGNDLYVIHEDDSESLLESHDEIDEALKLGLKIGIEVGFLPKKKPTSLLNWEEVDKKIINGHWWVKYGSQKFG
tara:strand:- start:3897 stop:4211 length:315 start_codon:yes stop_codon:yes gene_type:complete